MAKNRRRTAFVAVIFVVIAFLTGYKHLRSHGGYSLDNDGNITNVDVKRYDGEIIVPSEIDGVTVKTLSLDGVDGIRSIELDQAKHLESIRLNNIEIEYLDTSNNRELKQIWISHTRIERLNTKQNSMLETLGCANNRLKELDVSDNPKLKYIDCTGNKDISALNITNNPALKTVYVDPSVKVEGDPSVVQEYDEKRFSIENS